MELNWTKLTKIGTKLNKINENWDQIEYKPRDTAMCHNMTWHVDNIFKIKKLKNLKNLKTTESHVAVTVHLC